MKASPIRVTFDTNAWEKIFAPDDRYYSVIRDALTDGRILGFICEAGFRIEAITKGNRASYFAQPYMEAPAKIQMVDGHLEVRMSLGPDDAKHPGLPPEQIPKLQAALATGVKIIRGLSWTGLPGPLGHLHTDAFFAEERPNADARLQRQLDLFTQINSRGVGQAAFEAVDGWQERERTPTEQKRFSEACAEWADGELVGAHIAYRGDILCTNDRGRNAGASIFNSSNRAWLSFDFGVKFRTVEELAEELKAGAKA